MSTLETHRAVAATPAGQTLSRTEAKLEALYGERMSPRLKGRIERMWMRLAAADPEEKRRVA